MNPQLLVNSVRYEILLMIFPIVLISVQTLQPIQVLALQGGEIIPISIEMPRPPYAEGVVIGTVASTIISTYSNPEVSPFNNIQTLIDKYSEDKIVSNNELNSIKSSDSEIRSLLETPSSNEPDLGKGMNHVQEDNGIGNKMKMP